ncbi:uroporphyrinogen decarboxylase family protein, partial [Gemmatimonadota bacterium]
MQMTPQQNILAVLECRRPERAVFAPNIWQWFEYHKLHGKLHPEIDDCRTQLEVLRRLGADVFSRNLLTPVRTQWIGGHSTVRYRDVEVSETEDGEYRTVTYKTSRGELREKFRFEHEGCTLIQDEFLFKDFATEYPAWKALFEDRELVFDRRSFLELESEVADSGVVMVGETTCPLKQLHMAARADNAIYLLFDHEAEMTELMEIYAAGALKLIGEVVAAGARAVCSMDNLDSLFYSPEMFDKYCADFYRRAADICHAGGAVFFSHACGRQREIMSRVIACGLDGLEGIAFPPLGDIELHEARAAGERFIAEGGLSAVQLEGEITQQQADSYVKTLFEKLRPFERFVFSMSCNTSILTSWDTLRRYRDAWLKYR